MFKCCVLIFGLNLLSLASAQCDRIRLVQTKATDNLISNLLAGRIYEQKGYRVENVMASSSEDAYALLANDEADVYLSTWVPLDTEYLKPYALKGKVKTQYPLLTGAMTGLATNIFGQKAGLNSFEQIADFGEALNYTIFVGQDDWLFGQRMQAVIDSNIYGLSQFQVKRVHDFDFNEYLLRAKTQQKPILFFARMPSTMNNQYTAKFLTDSQHFFTDYQTSAKVYISTRYALPEDCPSVIKGLKALQISATQYQTIIAQKTTSLHDAVDNFLIKHANLVNQWLQAIPVHQGISK